MLKNLVQRFMGWEIMPMFKITPLSIVIVIISMLAFLCWLLTQYQLIRLEYKKLSIHKYLFWMYLVPGLQILWILWAIVSSNGFVKDLEQKYYKANLFQTAAGVQILSFPLMMLIVFWGVLGFIIRHDMFKILQSYEGTMYVNIIVMSMLILLGFYLSYLMSYTFQMKRYTKHFKSKHGH
ncbi:MAG TPA: hypothetical protein PL188_00135 [Candidatus Cloacimonadota bacterium]|nr:hypothetical protein [Candidatus Cloacimonadota bacterium]